MHNGHEHCMLAVDLGTSGCKTAVFTVTGKLLAWASRDVETLVFAGGGCEQRPDDWWDAFVETTRELLGKHPEFRDRIAGVCCGTQGEGTIPVDRAGTPLMNCIQWMDSRGAKYIQDRCRGLINIEGYGLTKLIRYMRLTGAAPSLTGKDPAGHMLFIREEHPDVYEKTHKFLNVLDYMNLKLTGNFVATFDSILTSWVTDNRTPSAIRYDDSLVARSGVERDKLPDIVPCTAVLGALRAEAAQALGLKDTVKVVAGAIDTTAAAIGTGAVEDYEPHIYLGTSSWMNAHVPFKKTDIFSAMASVPCAIPDRYLMIAMQTTCGGNLTFLRDKILYHKDALLQEAELPDVFKIMDRIAAETPPGANGVVYTPWIFGERSPIEDSHIRAGIHNLSLENSREDIIRAVFEGIALNTRWMLKPFEKNIGRQADRIVVGGGGANSDVWCQIFADVLDRPMRQLNDPVQANARGAALIGAVGLGEVEFRQVHELTSYRKTYTPNADLRGLYDDRFGVFTEIYKRNKGIYRRLNPR